MQCNKTILSAQKRCEVGSMLIYFSRKSEAEHYLQISVADMHHSDADPDPACDFDADTDPTFHINADPNPSFQIKAQNLAKVLK
jgi:hypothetical protein